MLEEPQGLREAERTTIAILVRIELKQNPRHGSSSSLGTGHAPPLSSGRSDPGTAGGAAALTKPVRALPPHVRPRAVVVLVGALMFFLAFSFFLMWSDASRVRVPRALLVWVEAERVKGNSRAKGGVC